MDLHAHVIALYPKNSASHKIMRPLIHALIDLGQIVDFNCAWEKCVMPAVPLGAAGNQKDSVSLDHTIARSDAGSDHWSNIKLMHFTCNVRKGAEYTDERRAKIGEVTKARWADPEQRAKLIAGSTKALNTDAVRERRSAAMKEYWARKKAQD